MKILSLINKLFTIISLSIVIIIAKSCSTDFEVAGAWEDIPVVFGVLDQSQEYQYIKVNKTFLGNQPASVMAQYSDSLYYENVKVDLIELNSNGDVISTYTFNEVDTIPKTEGYFADDRNVVFIGSPNLNENNLYKLNVIIDDGRKTVKSNPIELISGLGIIRPSPSLSFFNFANYDNAVIYEYLSGTESKVFQPKFIFHYIEVKGYDTTNYSIEFPQAVEVRSDVTTITTRRGQIESRSFFNLLASHIPEKPEGVKRYVRMPVGLQLTIATANEDYRTYMEITAPSHGIIQEKPSFTNLINGYGLFAAKFNAGVDIKVGQVTLDSISRGKYTQHLGFEGRNSQYYLNHF